MLLFLSLNISDEGDIETYHHQVNDTDALFNGVIQKLNFVHRRNEYLKFPLLGPVSSLPNKDKVL